MHNRKCNYPPPSLWSHSSRAARSPSHREASGRRLTPAPLRLPGTDRHNQGRTRSVHTGGRRGRGTCPPSFKHTGLLRTCKPARKRVTTSPANSEGLIYIRPSRVWTDPCVSPGARAQSWLAAEAASLLPFPAPKERGVEGGKRSETRAPADSVRGARALSSREGFPGRSGEPAPKAERRRLAGHRDWPRPA